MYFISFYVPESHLETVKNALFEAGAGKVGPYECCAWQTLGTGQYRPLNTASPYQGQLDQIEQVTEFKVELVCEDAIVKTIVETLFAVHPYETVAHAVLKMTDVSEI